MHFLTCEKLVVEDDGKISNWHLLLKSLGFKFIDAPKSYGVSNVESTALLIPNMINATYRNIRNLSITRSKFSWAIWIVVAFSGITIFFLLGTALFVNFGILIILLSLLYKVWGILTTPARVCFLSLLLISSYLSSIWISSIIFS